MSSSHERWEELAKKLPEPDQKTGPLLPRGSFHDDHVETESENHIILPGNGVTINACANKLFTRISKDKTLFQRGGAIVKVQASEDGNLYLHPITPTAFRSEIERFGHTFAWRSGPGNIPVLKPTVCPEDMSKALMATEAANNLLLPISMITNCALLIERAGCPEVLKKGYHRDMGGLLVTTGVEPARLVPQCSAWMLNWLIYEFDFQTPGDRARAFAMLLTPAMKMGGIIHGSVPITLLEADLSQSGKTYFAKLLAALYSEHPSIVPLRNGGVGSVDESFAHVLVGGRPFVLFDNFRGRLDSPYLEAFLTANGSFPARIPHCGTIQIDPQHYILMMTSNGVEITPDLANRACIIRIRKREGFQFRSYEEGDLLSHVRANQRMYLGCVFSIVGAWLRWGKPISKIAEHDFRAWAQPLDWICQNFGFGPLLADHKGAQVRVSNPSRMFCRNIAQAILQGENPNRKVSASELYAISESFGISIPGLASGDEGVAFKRIGKLMGQVFGEKNVVTFEGIEGRRMHSTEKRNGGGNYEATFYQFFRLPSATT